MGDELLKDYQETYSKSWELVSKARMMERRLARKGGKPVLEALRTHRMIYAEFMAIVRLLAEISPMDLAKVYIRKRGELKSAISKMEEHIRYSETLF